MGVPKFYRWLSERYPNINQQCNSIFKPEFDNLYLDMNGIIHNCSHGDDDHLRVRQTEEQIFANVFKYVDKLFQLARPQKLLFLAIDGVAPRAKMNQQRQRRFKSAQEAQAAIAEARKKGEISADDKPFDSNVITPGTEFMMRLSENIKFFIRKKLKEDAAWQKIQVIFSGAEVPGEGEHKIMLYIRNMKMQPNYSPNLRHCLYGLDADLIFLSLVSHEPHFALLREEVVFGGGRQHNLPRKQLKKLDEFQFLHISVLREYIELEYAAHRSHFHGGFNLERLIDDWVVLAFLCGNDFLPHLPTLDIGEGGLDTLFRLYKDALPSLGGYIVENRRIRIDRLEVILSRMGELEEEVFQNRLEQAVQDEKKARKFHRSKKNVEIPQSAFFAGEKLDSTELEPEDEKKDELTPITGEGDSGFSPSSFDVPEDLLEETTGATMKARYYHDKFPEFFNRAEMQHRSPELLFEGAPESPDEWIRYLVRNYLEGLNWVFYYYYDGVPSWKWYYQFRYAPLASDLRHLNTIKVEFQLGQPFKPLEQLLGTLPPSSRFFLPAPYRELMIGDSPIVDFYPTTFDVDMNGKRNAWEGIALIPFIDEARLLGAVNKIDRSSLSKSERIRNLRIGYEYRYVYDDSCREDYPSTMAAFPSIKECCSRVEIWNLPPIPIDGKAAEAPAAVQPHNNLIDCQERDISDALETAAFQQPPSGHFQPDLPAGCTVPLPGFPYLKAFQVACRLGRVSVNVFGSESRKDSCVLSLPSNVGGFTTPSTEALARAFVGKRAYMEWPFFRECIVESVYDAKTRWTTDGPAAMRSTEIEKFGRDANFLRNQLLTTRAVETGPIHAFMSVRPFEMMKRMDDGSIQKIFSDEEQPVPWMLVLPRLTAPDDRFVEKAPPTLADAFPIGRDVIYIGPNHYGVLASIVGHSCTEPGRQSVRLSLIPPVPEPDFGHMIASQSRLQYYPSYMVAKALDIHPLALAKITSSVFINGIRDLDLGIRVRFGKQGVGVPEYARRVDSWQAGNNPQVKEVAQKNNQGYSSNSDAGGSWEYSEKCIALLAAYKKRFPAFFEVLNSNPQTYKYEGTDFVVGSENPTREQGLAAVKEIADWLKTVGINNLILIPCSSQVMADRGVKAIEQESTKVHTALAKKAGPRIELNNVPLHHLYPPNPSTPWSPTETQSTELGDRVLTIRSDSGAPLALKGTIVAVHGKFAEIVFDEDFVNGNSLSGRCSHLRGQTMPISGLLNLSKPTVLVPKTVKKNNIPEASQVDLNAESSAPVRVQEHPKQTVNQKHQKHNNQSAAQSHAAKPAANAAPAAAAASSSAPAPAAAPAPAYHSTSSAADLDAVSNQLKAMIGIGAPSASAQAAAPAPVQPGEEDVDIDPVARKLAEKKAKKAAQQAQPAQFAPPHQYPPQPFYPPYPMPMQPPYGMPMPMPHPGMQPMYYPPPPMMHPGMPHPHFQPPYPGQPAFESGADAQPSFGAPESTASPTKPPQTGNRPNRGGRGGNSRPQGNRSQGNNQAESAFQEAGNQNQNQNQNKPQHQKKHHNQNQSQEKKPQQQRPKQGAGDNQKKPAAEQKQDQKESQQ